MEDRIEELEGLLTMSRGREAVVSEQLSRLEQKSSRLEEERSEHGCTSRCHKRVDHGLDAWRVSKQPCV